MRSKTVDAAPSSPESKRVSDGLAAALSVFDVRSVGHRCSCTNLADGRLVCSFAQDNMIRKLPQWFRPLAGEKSRF